jgi:hypothetical protein
MSIKVNVVIVTLAVVLSLGAASGGRAAGPACPIDGEPVQWIADYCMSKLETDDEIAAAGCIAKELTARHASVCDARRHYKRAMCDLAVARASYAGSSGQCVADRDFVGSTVRNGGVGGPASPASGVRAVGTGRR